MNEIVQLMKSPGFWFASVIVAFLMSLFASFVKDWTEKWWSSLSRKRSAKAQEQAKSFQEKISKLRNNPALVATYHTEIVYQKLRQVLYYLVSYVCMFLGADNFLNGAERTGIAFTVLSLLAFAGPVQIVSRKLRHLSAIANSVSDDDEIHFSE